MGGRTNTVLCSEIFLGWLNEAILQFMDSRRREAGGIGSGRRKEMAGLIKSLCSLAADSASTSRMCNPVTRLLGNHNKTSLFYNLCFDS
jgi:hypothetical protein